MSCGMSITPRSNFVKVVSSCAPSNYISSSFSAPLKKSNFYVNGYSSHCNHLPYLYKYLRIHNFMHSAGFVGVEINIFFYCLSVDNLRMNCSPVCLSNVCGPGLHRKLWSGFLQVKRRSLSLPGLPGIIIVVV